MSPRGRSLPWRHCRGGPGSGHDYLEPLEKLAKDRPVIFYDQLGCGKSDQPTDRSLWRIDWNRIDRLSEIGDPTLILAGRYDEMTAACSETIHRGIADSQFVIFEKSSHIPHIEEEAKYHQVVSRFLSRIDAKNTYTRLT